MPFKTTHPAYSAWQGMKQRCLNPNNRSYKDYGGRGIAVCVQWSSCFATFAQDMGPKPAGMSLDRINNDAGYSPENCRWASHTTQLRNQRCTRYVTIEGRRYKAVVLAEKSGLKTDTIVDRAAKSMTLAEVLDPKRKPSVSSPEAKARIKAGQRAAKAAITHCVNGHEFTPDTTYRCKQGWRRCRACRRKPKRL